MENRQTQKKARWLSITFVAIIAVILIGLTVCVVATPYDSGVLIGASLSGNNLQGGHVASSNDYLFYTAKGNIMQYDKGSDETKSIYEGEVSHLNPYDGWLYFVEAGKIQRIAYYGGMKTQIGTADNVTMMSVNGLWIYYLDADGCINKIRSDGEKQSRLTDGNVTFTAFESANRIILATDGKNIYRMKTDGTEMAVLVKGTEISFMLYTLDNLYYCDKGQVKELRSVEAGQDDGTSFGELTATLFNYNVNTERRGQIFYVKGNELRVRLLQSVEHDKEEDRLLTQATDITDLYSIDSDVYFHNSQGQLFMVRINESECTVEEVE